MLPLYNRDPARDYFREKPEETPCAPHRSEFRRDYARLIHSPSFRRLDGKTQLFPVMESDFFRNRLTHSLEVAQIAKSIALKLNEEDEHLQSHPVDTDLVEFAALAHDLGHPPFGHNGEAMLNDLMSNAGGFEGNAQTLRILAVTEKKGDNGAGLNLTYRSLAAVLKYDRKIPGVPGKFSKCRKESSAQQLTKGYYASEEDLVAEIKGRIANGRSMPDGGFKTMECHIMDVADDIAYSVYDLEDALKAEFISFVDIFGANEALLDKVAGKVESKLSGAAIGPKDVQMILVELLLQDLKNLKGELLNVGGASADDRNDTRVDDDPYALVDRIAPIKGLIDKFSKSGSYRSQITSRLVSAAIDAVTLSYNEEFPELSIVDFTPDYRRKIEVLKNFVYCSIIESPRLKVAEYRGAEIVRAIFDALDGRSGHLLLPDDYKGLYDGAVGDAKKRVICDFIAGMTDRYAIEFYGRLKSENPQTIFKPF